MIQNEGYPVNYSNNLNCSWTIRASSMEQVILTFNTIMVDDCETCECDHIQIRDGPHISSPIIGRYCGEITQPFSVISSGNAITVEFMTDVNNEGEALNGFSANYTSIPMCGGNFSTMNGTIMSPAVNNMYPHNADCVYQITVPPMYRVFFKVERLILQDKGENNICSDYLELKESASGIDLGRYCGEMDRFSVITSGNTAWARFVSDNVTTSQGFTVFWDAIDCTNEYTSATGMISSPSFGGLYPSNANCTYNITLPENKNVFLKFSLFELEEQALEDAVEMPGQDCADSLEIYDSGRQLEAYCGLRDPFSIISTTNMLFLTFTTNFPFNRRGFMAEYETTDALMVHTDYNGLITPPLYQFMYAHNINKNFTIIRPQNEPIFLTVINFEVQESVNGTCLDYLQIGIERTCGEQDPMMYLFYGSVSFSFVSDLSISGAGFQAQYDVCNTTITDESGMLRSPGYPAVVYENITCSHTLLQTYQRMFVIDFTDFQLPPKVNGVCESYVKITDLHTGDIGITTESGGQMMMETRLCGNRGPFNVTIKAREINIMYKSLFSRNTFGYRMNFTISDIPSTTTSTTTTQIPTETTVGDGGPGTTLNNSLSVPIIVAIIIISVLLFIIAVICIIKAKSSQNNTGSLEMLSVRRTRQSTAVFNPAYESNDELNRGEFK
ncbi:cubilin-like [Saccostrea echinata]|uniref:cubilin-like n=1 Tax=Saccostrea echinata TaxID=191078 RepID=UPI002A7FE367|nr:cubilin-like [Saccostrea echinata]